ncbi:MAG: class I SAM-dependent methyltransferase [Firmicutes bacterium]|nr:class I SAM-dependent methyltransferase [Bacillota bacterium]
MPDNTKLFYDLVAEKTADEWYDNDLLLKTIEDFMNYLPDKPKVLDLGCGPGHESMRLYHCGARVVGVDFSSESIKIAKERCPQCNFKELDFRNLNHNIGKFDGVFANAFFIHIAPEEMNNILNRVNNVLKDNTYMLITLIEGEGIHEEWSNMTVAGKKLKRTVYCYKKESIINKAKSYSFEYINEGFLDDTLLEYGWRAYIFKKSEQIS